MKRNLFFLLTNFLALPALLQAQDGAASYTKYEGHLFSRISNDGKWAIENIGSGKGSNILNVSNKTVSFYEKLQCNAISEEEILVGQEDNVPVYVENQEMKKLPCPNDPLFVSGTAWDISASGELICGALTFKNPNRGQYDLATIRKPCIWERKENGFYVLKMLSFPLKDPTNLTVQAVDAQFCNNNIVSGRVIDNSGFRNYAISWQKDENGEWQYKELGIYNIFKKDVSIPQSAPLQPEKVNAMEFFTKEDSVQYQVDVEKFENKETNKNPIYYQRWYITNLDSLAAYSEAMQQFKEKEVLYKKKMNIYKDSLNNSLTGNQFDMFAASKSNKGNYMIVGYRCTDESNDRKRTTVPAYFNLKDGSLTIKRDLSGLMSGLTMTDIMFYATPADAPFRTASVYDTRNNNEMLFAEWVKKQTDGKIYVDPATDDATGEVTLMGMILPSDNGNILCGFLQRPDRARISYIIDLGKDSLKTDAPQNLELETGLAQLHLSWQDPSGVSELGYSTKAVKEGDGVGNEGKPMIGAIQFSPNDLKAYSGQFLNSLTFYVNKKCNDADRVETQMSIAIFEGGKRIVNQPIGHLNENAWNTVALDIPLFITGKTSLQVGLELVQHDVDEWPLGVCLRSEDSGKSDLFTTDGGKSWETLESNSVMRRWNIFANVSANKEAKKATDVNGYKLYFNGVLFQEEMIKTQDISVAIPQESGSFTVTAVYNSGIESERSNDVVYDYSGLKSIESDGWGTLRNKMLVLNRASENVAIYDTAGVMVANYNSGEMEIDLSALDGGIYILVLDNKDGRSAYKVAL